MQERRKIYLKLNETDEKQKTPTKTTIETTEKLAMENCQEIKNILFYSRFNWFRSFLV